MDRNLPADAGELRCHGGRVVLEVGLREQHDRPRAALDGEREVTLEQPAVDLLAERMHDEHEVDVGSDHLLARDARCRLVRGATGDRRSPRHDVDDGARRVERDPVADDRKLRLDPTPAARRLVMRLRCSPVAVTTSYSPRC